MKIGFKNSFLVFVLLVTIGSGHLASAQNFTTLHSFNASTEGANPYCRLVLSDHILYGTTKHGGNSGSGTVFAVNADGTGFTVLHNFSMLTNYTNSDGAYPVSGLVLSGGTLYGPASQGGISGSGTIFKLSTNGTDFITLYNFTAQDMSAATNSDGASPLDVIFASNRVYAATATGGTLGGGTVFAINDDGTGFANLHSFPRDNVSVNLRSGVILFGGTLYGTTEGGGSSGSGSVYGLNIDGSGFTNLYSFTPLSGNYTNIDGGYPIAALTISGNALYGTTIIGGTGTWGTVFRVNTDGTAFTNLHSFGVSSSNSFSSDGTGTAGPLVVRGNTLYGTAWVGGSSGNGTVFAVDTDGTDFTLLHNFTPTSVSSGWGASGTNADGANPQASLILSGNTLYGTTVAGGASGQGTIFSISLLPKLTITPASENFVLSWPTNNAGFDYSGFTLQSTTNLTSPVWTTNLAAPVAINGQYTVTNSISGTQKFFRLAQ